VREEAAIRIIAYQSRSEDLRLVVSRIVQDLQDSHIYEGELFITRVLPSRGSSASTATLGPHLIVEQEKCAKFLGLIPHRRKTTILLIKEALYNVAGTGGRDMFVVVRCRSCEPVVRKHLEEYGRRHRVTRVVYRGRNRFEPRCMASL